MIPSSIDCLVEFTATPCERSTHHSLIASSNSLTSSAVFPACRQILTLDVPSGTVGGTTALTIIPLSCRNFANAFGSLNWIEKIGLCGRSVGNVRSA